MPKSLTALQWNTGERQRKIDAIHELTQKAQAEGRTPTDEDRVWVDKQMGEIAQLDKVIANLQDSEKLDKMVEELTSTNHAPVAVGGKSRPVVRTAGEYFVNSPQFTAAIEAKKAGQRFSFQVEIPHYLAKTAITDDSGNTVLSEGAVAAGDTTGGGGGTLPQPDVQAGIRTPGYQRLTIADLMPQLQTNGNTVRYLAETTTTNNAASTHEGANKPASLVGFDDTDEKVRKIATFLPVSTEMLQDVAQLQGYLQTRLRTFVQIEEEDQLLNGVGSGDDLNGLLNRVTQTFDASTVTNVFDAIANAFVKVRAVGFAEPSGIVINPHDAVDLDTAKSSVSGDYYSGGPYGASPRNPWGVPMVITNAIPAGHILVGDFRNYAAIFRNGGLTVNASDSHEDYFTRNLVAIRAEERLALAVYNLNAFVEITNAS